VALREGRRTQLVHARSYIPTFVALVVRTLTGRPFIFDMRALWPDEMVAAGRLKADSALFRLIKWVERTCILKAAAVVSLTQAGVDHLHRVYGEAVRDVRFAVIPTCVDLDRFRPAAPRPGLEVVGSVGSVLSGWFRLEWLAHFMKTLSDSEPQTAMRIVTREDEAAIRDRLGSAGVPLDRVEVFGVAPAEVPVAIASLSAAAMFFETGVAKLGSCPTRMGEILATGLPVVANPGVGDVGEIITRYRVGVLVEENTDEAMREAVLALKALLKDPELPVRCRQAAEDWFSLEKGAATYARLYAEAV
jgi:glycosyltransferase involved in cell wall biosynthesis